MCLNETYSRVRKGRTSSDISRNRKSLEQGDALSPLLFKFSLEYAVSKIQGAPTTQPTDPTRRHDKFTECIILPVVLYGCETWSLTLREERKLRVFENMVFRRIFGPRRNEVTGEWRRLRNEELNDLYSSPNIVRVIKSRRMRWAGHVAHMGEERGCIGSWWGNRRERDHWGDLGVDGWILG